MSSREPLWYCHQCRAEMRPLLMPDPVCASCHGSFVEKMEDGSDDPRAFQQPGGPDLGDLGGATPGVDMFLLMLQSLIAEGRENSGRPGSPRRNPDSTSRPSNSFSFEMRSGPGGRSVRLGGPNTLGGPDRVPTMSEYIRRDSDTALGGNAGIRGPLMAQYLMALLGRNPLGEMGLGGEGAAERGRMGDYVFNQEALDQIITQLMENSNTHRPVPATEEITENLPREVLEAGSPTLEKDCAVCKEQFKIDTEDPDEQIIITLPCKHPFHQSCILPWLKSSGTCPVCRYALVPQPEHHSPPASPGPGSGAAGPRESSRRSSSGGSSRPPGSPGSGGASGSLLQSLYGMIGGGGNSSGGNTSGGSSRHNRSSSDTDRRPRSQPRSPGNTRNNLPGSWDDVE